MTETCSQIATAKLSSLNQKNFSEVSLLSHAEARTNTEGFLQVKASSLFSFYAQNGRGVWDPKVDGWFTTEDKGEVTNGVLQIAGRGHDFIKIGGEASSLLRLRGVLEAAVMQTAPALHQEIVLLDWPSERLGSEVHLVFTTLVSSADRENVCAAFNLKVLPFERIRAYHEVSSLPRSELGKILTAELKRALK
jgi:O-succinylbenzoic acid--CoA ligase